MGLLRLLLALIVVGSHLQYANQQWGVGNVLAVKAFFVISGFYMSMVLAERYRDRLVQFYLNRVLRLWPLHLLMLAATLLLVLMSPTYMLAGFFRLDLWAVLLENPELHGLAALLMLANVFIVGSDVALFFCLNTQTLQTYLVSANGICEVQPSIPLFAFLLNTPMWTVSLELVFYLLAPLLVRSNTVVLVVLTVLAGAARLLLVQYGLDQPPWNRSIVVFELVYFLLGIGAYRLYRVLRTRSVDRGVLGLAGGVTLAVTVLAGPAWSWLYIALIVVSVPYLFLLTRGSAVDRAFGNLSYPVYVCQYIALDLVQYFLKPLLFDSGLVGTWIVVNVVAVLIVAAGSVTFVTEPLERARHGLASSAARTLRSWWNGVGGGLEAPARPPIRVVPGSGDR